MNAISSEGAVVAVAELPRAERFFLWAMRAWSAHHTDLSAIWWSLDQAFTHERIPQALAPFDQAMATVFTGLKRWPDIRCVACPRLGSDERHLQHAFAHLQHGNAAVALSALQCCVLGSAARVVLRHAGKCVDLAYEVGLQFVPVSSLQGHIHVQQSRTQCG
jgi:hypothetical protein